MASRVGSLFVGFGLDDAQYRAGMKGAVATAQKSTALIQTNFSTLNFRTFLYGMAGIYAVQRAIKGVFAPAVELESGLAKISTVLDKASQSFLPQYKAEIQSMAKEYGQSIDTLTTGAREILGSVIAPEKAMGVLRESTKAATAGLTDTATATNALVTLLKSYGMQAEKSAAINDMLFAGILRGRGTYEQWANSIGVVASSAALSGLKIEELVAMMAVMTRQGLSADMATISLANVLNNFVGASDEAKAAAKGLGFVLDENTIRTIGMTNVMQALSKANLEQIKTIFPNIRGYRGVAAGLQDLSGYMDDYQAVVNSTGSEQVALERVMASTEFKLKQLKQTLLQDLVIPMGEAVVPAIREGTAELIAWVRANKEAIATGLGNAIRSVGDEARNFTAVIKDNQGAIKLFGELLIVSFVWERLERFGRWLGKIYVEFEGILSLGTALYSLFYVTLGAAAIIGVKGIYDHLKKISLLKFKEVERLGDTIVFSSTGKGVTAQRDSVDALEMQTKNVGLLRDQIMKMAEAGQTATQIWNKFTKSFSETGGIAALGESATDVMEMITAAVKEAKERAMPLPKAGIVGGISPKALKQAEDALRTLDKLELDKYNKRKKLDEEATAKVLQYNSDILQATRDTEMMKLEAVYKGTELQIKQEELRSQYVLDDLKAEYKGFIDTKRLEVAMETLTTEQIKLIRYNATQEAVERSIQAWEQFKGHFSHILARMVTESNLSAKAIGQAFVDAFRRIAIERASALAVDEVFDWASTLPIIGSALGWLASGPAGGAAGGAIGSGLGNVMKKPIPAFAPAGVQNYNSNSNDDYSNVKINIYADSDTLRNIDPYKFGELYRRAKRDGYLGG